MYLFTRVKSFFSSVMVFSCGVVTGFVALFAAGYVYVTYFNGESVIDDYLTRHHFVTQTQYLEILALVAKQNHSINTLNSGFDDLKIAYKNTVRLLPFHLPDEVKNDERVLQRYDNSDGSGPMIASSNLSPAEKKQQQCAIWIVSYSSNPSPALLKKIDSQCK